MATWAASFLRTLYQSVNDVNTIIHNSKFKQEEKEMINIIPAIDIIGGKCVRLSKGDYAQKKVYADDPLEVAKDFERMGFRRLHVVDLDGAKSKHIVNYNTLRRITEETSLAVDFGGGIKSNEDIEKAFSNGATFTTVGSIAVTEEELFSKWLEKYGPERIILGADVRGGKISVNGWKEDTSIELMSFLKRYVALGVKNVLCTDISRDGMLNGPSCSLYESILKLFPDINLIASGGVSGIDDIRQLDRINVPSVVVGKAFYEGKITPEDLNDKTFSL